MGIVYNEDLISFNDRCFHCDGEMIPLYHNNYYTCTMPSWYVGAMDGEKVEVKACVGCGSVRVFKE